VQNRGEVAAVIMEPLRSEAPPDGYLAAVADIVRQHGAVLVFDEVSTGLRFAFGGAQEYVGVTPDIAVFAKSISNGYPFGVVVGKRDVMEPVSRMFISSTYWSDTIGLRACLETLRLVRERNIPAQLWSSGEQLQTELQRVADPSRLPVRCTGLAIHPHLAFDVTDPALQAQLATLYIQEMAKRGCHGYASFYLNAAQGEAELRQTVDAAGEVFDVMREALERNQVEQRLECSVQQEVFRRLVR